MTHELPRHEDADGRKREEIMKKSSWHTVIILLNASTIITSLSLAYLGSRLSGVSYKYEKLIASADTLDKSLTKLKNSVSANATAVKKLYTLDSIRKIQLNENKRKVFNTKTENPSIPVDTAVMYVKRNMVPE